MRFLFFILFLSISSQAVSVDVQSLRVWAGPDKTRAVLDLGAKAEYRLFQLSNPARVVVDLEQSRLLPDFIQSDITGSIISDVRTGKRGKQGLRIVFDLKSGANPKSFMLQPIDQYGHRLVVDFFSKDTQVDKPPVKRVTEIVKTNRDVVIAIVAGHGGEDPGAIGPTGLREKDVVLKIAREVKKQIDAHRGMRAVLVRDGDYYVPHSGRLSKARDERADLFVSIHADAFRDSKVRGSSVFILNNRRASNEASKWLADRINRSDLIGGVSLDDKDDTLAATLLDLSQSASMQASRDAAEHVLEALKGVGKIHGSRVKEESLVVLTSPDIPSILVETAYISNPQEEKYLRSKAWRKKMATAIVDGIRSYFYASPPPRSWLANNPVKDTHVVSRGETLSEIATQHQVSLSQLRAANGLKGDLVKIGEVLKIPAG